MLQFLLVVLAVTLGAAGSGPGPGPESGPGGAAVTAGAGPALVAEDQTPTGRFLTATEVKPILTATKANWIAVREWDGKDLVYVTHLWAWRCGLLRMEVAMNGGPAEIWDLPACHAESAQPGAILDGDGLPYREFGLGSVQQVTVTLTYDDLSTDSVTVERAEVLMP